MNYEEKRQRVIRRLEKIEIQYQTGGRLVDGGSFINTTVGEEHQLNIIEIADEIMSLFGHNKPTDKLEKTKPIKLPIMSIYGTSISNETLKVITYK